MSDTPVIRYSIIKAKAVSRWDLIALGQVIFMSSTKDRCKEEAQRLIKKGYSGNIT